MLNGIRGAPARGGRPGYGTLGSRYVMKIGHWTAAVLVASLLAACNTPRDDSGAAAGGMAGTPTDTTLTGGQGGMADTSMGGLSDTMADTADTTRP